MFDLRSKDENDNILAAGTAVLLKFESLSSLEKFIVSVYYTNYPMTHYFQIYFIRVSCTLNARDRMRTTIKNINKILAKKVKYHDNPVPKK